MYVTELTSLFLVKKIQTCTTQKCVFMPGSLLMLCTKVTINCLQHMQCCGGTQTKFFDWQTGPLTVKLLLGMIIFSWSCTRLKVLKHQLYFGKVLEMTILKSLIVSQRMRPRPPTNVIGWVSCPTVIRSLRMDVDTRSEKDQCHFVQHIKMKSNMIRSNVVH